MNTRPMSDAEIRERSKHQETINNIREVLRSKAGRAFVKYLLESLDVGEMPPIGLTGDLLMDRIGFLRAGASVYKLCVQADSEQTCLILGQIEKERYNDSQG